MSKCETCFYKGNTEFDACHICSMERDMYKPMPKPITNADRIRAMTDEEMAEWLDKLVDHCNDGPCYNCLMRDACRTSMIYWLRQEAGNG